MSLQLITASDAEDGDLFGFAVGTDGQSAIVGSWSDDDNGSTSGSAYIFDADTGSQLHKLTASDGASGDRFGSAVAISGNFAIIGSQRDDDGGSQSGSAYLFDVTTGTQLHKLNASDASNGDRFGFSVAVSGNLAIVGSYRDDDNGSNSGSAYVFDTLTGSQLLKLTPADGSGGDRFGYSVGISGNTAIVGSYLDDDFGSNSGSAYLFDLTTGSQLHKLNAADAGGGDRFGFSVAISGANAIVGATREDSGGSNAGAAYLFDVASGAQLSKLTASDADTGDNFGFSVSISANNAVVGSVFDDDEGLSSGSAYLFDVSTGSELEKLTAPGASAQDESGYSVGIGGSSIILGIDTAIVGSPGDDESGSQSGSAYLTTTSPTAIPDTLAGYEFFGALLGMLILARRLRRRRG